MENGVFTIPLSAKLAAAEANAPHARLAAATAQGTERSRSAAAHDAKSPAIHSFATTLEFHRRPGKSAGRPWRSNRSCKSGRRATILWCSSAAPGTGKTHLARGLAECWAARHSLPPASAVYFTASDFANDLKAAIEAESDARIPRARSRSVVIGDRESDAIADSPRCSTRIDPFARRRRRSRGTGRCHVAHRAGTNRQSVLPIFAADWPPV